MTRSSCCFRLVHSDILKQIRVPRGFVSLRGQCGHIQRNQQNPHRYTVTPKLAWRTDTPIHRNWCGAPIQRYTETLPEGGQHNKRTNRYHPNKPRKSAVHRYSHTPKPTQNAQSAPIHRNQPGMSKVHRYTNTPKPIRKERSAPIHRCTDTPKPTQKKQSAPIHRNTETNPE